MWKTKAVSMLDSFLESDSVYLHVVQSLPSLPTLYKPLYTLLHLAPKPPCSHPAVHHVTKGKLHPALHQSSSTTRTHAVYHPVSHQSRQRRRGSSLPVALFLLPHCTVIPLVHHSCCCPFQIWRTTLILRLFQHDWPPQALKPRASEALLTIGDVPP